MVKYIIKRILQAIVVVFLITCITFFLMNLVPGGPFLSEKSPSPEVLKALEAKYGLDQPLIIQLKNYISDLLKGDWGVSFKMQKKQTGLDDYFRNVSRFSKNRRHCIVVGGIVWCAYGKLCGLSPREKGRQCFARDNDLRGFYPRLCCRHDFADFIWC